MSSRKQDAQKLVQLAEVAATNADNLQKVATLLGRFNEAIARLEQQTQELIEANDDLERRLLTLEQRG
jgi:hypothetical protein